MSWVLMYFEEYENNKCSAVKWLMNLSSKNQMNAEVHHGLPWSWKLVQVIGLIVTNYRDGLTTNL